MARAACKSASLKHTESVIRGIAARTGMDPDETVRDVMIDEKPKKVAVEIDERIALTLGRFGRISGLSTGELLEGLIAGTVEDPSALADLILSLWEFGPRTRAKVEASLNAEIERLQNASR